MLVQALLAELAVERLDERVVRRLTRPAEVEGREEFIGSSRFDRAGRIDCDGRRRASACYACSSFHGPSGVFQDARFLLPAPLVIGATQRMMKKLLVVNVAAATLLSALLLFEVQPILSKFILPWFGGSPAVWTTCMVFFQTLLFAGYAYAHLSVSYFRPRIQALAHVALLLGAICMLPITPDAGWRLEAAGAPTWRILFLLAVSVGLPYFALSATGPLVQAWACRLGANGSAYRLYALSNVGSLAALLAYPFFIEPRYRLGEQTSLWGVGFTFFAGLCAAVALSVAVAGRADGPREAEPESDTSLLIRPRWRDRLVWLALPAMASIMLLATTNHVCQDVAVMPFLWVAPLALYLLSFVACFDHPRWYVARGWALAALVSAEILLAMGALRSNTTFHFSQELAPHFLALFALCMVCHGELVRRRPDPRYLTGFYLMISAGGALGGLFVILVAPHIFSSFAEWHLSLVIGCLLSVWVLFENKPESFVRRRFALVAPAVLAAFVVINSIPALSAARLGQLFVSARNFYGVVSVVERDSDDPAHHSVNLYSGRIVHGLQFVDAAKKHEPTTYYGRASGIGQVLAKAGGCHDLRVGAVGLGVGTLATYATPGQYFRFYEINDQVIDFARRYFSYLTDCRGTCDVVLGDARLSLEQEPPQRFDLLILDAFSGDAVPTHLLTKEAFESYRRHLVPGAIVAVHISNAYLDLGPVVAGLAEHFEYTIERVTSGGDPEQGVLVAEWIVLTPAKGETHEVRTSQSTTSGEPPRRILWTDDYSNLYEILK